MRKYLLSTSAIAGAALLSSAALADLSITGSVEFEYSDSDSNIAANDTKSMASNNEIYVDFTNKTEMREFFHDGIAILEYFLKKRGTYFSKKHTKLIGIETR